MEIRLFFLVALLFFFQKSEVSYARSCAPLEDKRYILCDESICKDSFFVQAKAPSLGVSCAFYYEWHRDDGEEWVRLLIAKIHEKHLAGIYEIVVRHGYPTRPIIDSEDKLLKYALAEEAGFCVILKAVPKPFYCQDINDSTRQKYIDFLASNESPVRITQIREGADAQDFERIKAQAERMIWDNRLRWLAYVLKTAGWFGFGLATLYILGRMLKKATT